MAVPEYWEQEPARKPLQTESKNWEIHKVKREERPTSLDSNMVLCYSTVGM